MENEIVKSACWFAHRNILFAKKTISNTFIYSRITDDIYSALILEKIAAWTPHMTIERDGDFWMTRKYEEWEYECGVKPSTARKAIKRLVDSRLVHKKNYHFRGKRQQHLKLNLDEFLPQFLNKFNSAVSMCPTGTLGNVLSGHLEMSSQDTCYITILLTKILDNISANSLQGKDKKIFKEDSQRDVFTSGLQKQLKELEDFQMKKGLKPVEKKKKGLKPPTETKKGKKETVHIAPVKNIVELVKADPMKTKKTVSMNTYVIGGYWEQALKDYCPEASGDCYINTQKKGGQMKMFMKLIKELYLNHENIDPYNIFCQKVVSYIVREWPVITEIIAEQCGLKVTPDYPNIGFIVQHKYAVMDTYFYQKEFKKKPKSKKLEYEENSIMNATVYK